MLKLTITAKGEKALKEAVIKACWEVADRIFSEAQNNLATKEWAGMGAKGAYSSLITDTGELLGSGTIERNEHGAKITFSADYASAIEYGMPPGTYGPPAEILAAWCTRKLGVPKKDAISVAWAIKQKIFEEGTTARPFLRNAVYDTIAEYANKKVKK